MIDRQVLEENTIHLANQAHGADRRVLHGVEPQTLVLARIAVLLEEIAASLLTLRDRPSR